MKYKRYRVYVPGSRPVKLWVWTLVKLAGFVTTLCLLFSAPLWAASIALGYNSSDKDLVVGMAASLSGDSSSSQLTVERATSDKEDKFVGIVTTQSNSSLVITNKQSKVYITTSGEAKVLVTDLAGRIKKGDFLTLSPLKGYMMKADNSGLKSFGVALEDFNTDAATTQRITDKKNQAKDVKVASIAAKVTAANNVAVAAVSGRPFLSAFARSLTGKEVNQWQILSALVIFFVLLVAVGSIIYSAVHSTIEALGRNPLAHTDIYKQLIQVVIISLGVLAFGGIIIYVILWA
jgi:uncharacterized membrane protein YidH (DUF202 family)